MNQDSALLLTFASETEQGEGTHGCKVRLNNQEKNDYRKTNRLEQKAKKGGRHGLRIGVPAE